MGGWIKREKGQTSGGGRSTQVHDGEIESEREREGWQEQRRTEEKGMEKKDKERKRAEKGSRGGGGTGERFAEWLLYVIFSSGIRKAGWVFANEQLAVLKRKMEPESQPRPRPGSRHGPQLIRSCL